MKRNFSLKEVIGHWMKQSGKDLLFKEIQIKELWLELLGESIYSKTKKIEFTQEGNLMIKISDALLKNELHYAKVSIQEKLNEKLQDFQIKEIYIL